MAVNVFRNKPRLENGDPVLHTQPLTVLAVKD